MALMRRQSLVKFDAPLCETVVDTPKPQGAEVLVRIERCGLCQFVHGGVMLNAAAHLPALPLPHFFRLPGEDRFAAHIPELPQRPPLTAA